MKILFTKIRDVKSPDRAYGTADAFDFYVPTFSDSFKNDIISINEFVFNSSCNNSFAITGGEILLFPHCRMVIPTGIRVLIQDEDTCLLALNKSGVATKKGVITGAQLVDHDYTGEVLFSCINTSNTVVHISPDEKLIQFMHTPIIHSALVEVDNQEYENYSLGSARGGGAFGSSNK